MARQNFPFRSNDWFGAYLCLTTLFWFATRFVDNSLLLLCTVSARSTMASNGLPSVPNNKDDDLKETPVTVAGTNPDGAVGVHPPVMKQEPEHHLPVAQAPTHDGHPTTTTAAATMQTLPVGARPIMKTNGGPPFPIDRATVQPVPSLGVINATTATRPASPVRNAAGMSTAKRNGPPALPPRPPSKASAVGASATAAKRSTAKRALPGTRKPRPKRPKSGAEKRSTVTTATETAHKPVNVYDAVLGEAEDLLQAASEAQHLGRLKMASAYLLLLHARLVGIGKRFDRAVQREGQRQDDMSGTTSSAASTPNSSGDTVNTETPDGTATTANAQPPPSPVVQELAHYLPGNIDFDSKMMEHLAKAAIDLHHIRTGRKIHGDHSPNLLNSPGNSIAWTQQEKDICIKLFKEGKHDVEIASNLHNRTPAQVRAFLHNCKERQKGARAMEQEFEESPRKKGRGKKPPTQAINTVPNAKVNARYLLSGKALGNGVSSVQPTIPTKPNVPPAAMTMSVTTATGATPRPSVPSGIIADAGTAPTAQTKKTIPPSR